MSTRTLQNSIRPQPFWDTTDTAVVNTLSIWSRLLQTTEPDNILLNIQKVWDSIVASAQQAELLSEVYSNNDQPRLLAAALCHSGDLLQAPSIMAVGL